MPAPRGRRSSEAWDCRLVFRREHIRTTCCSYIILSRGLKTMGNSWVEHGILYQSIIRTQPNLKMKDKVDISFDDRPLRHEIVAWFSGESTYVQRVVRTSFLAGDWKQWEIVELNTAFFISPLSEHNQTWKWRIKWTSHSTIDLWGHDEVRGITLTLLSNWWQLFRLYPNGKRVFWMNSQVRSFIQWGKRRENAGKGDDPDRLWSCIIFYVMKSAFESQKTRVCCLEWSRGFFPLSLGCNRNSSDGRLFSACLADVFYWLVHGNCLLNYQPSCQTFG